MKDSPITDTKPTVKAKPGIFFLSDSSTSSQPFFHFSQIVEAITTIPQSEIMTQNKSHDFWEIEKKGTLGFSLSSSLSPISQSFPFLFSYALKNHNKQNNNASHKRNVPRFRNRPTCGLWPKPIPRIYRKKRRSSLLVFPRRGAIFKVSDWFVQNAGSNPSGCVIRGINQIGRRDANSHLIRISPFIKILPMGLLVIPIVIVGALVTLLEENRTMFWLSSPKPGDPAIFSLPNRCLSDCLFWKTAAKDWKTNWLACWQCKSWDCYLRLWNGKFSKSLVRDSFGYFGCCFRKMRWMNR